MSLVGNGRIRDAEDWSSFFFCSSLITAACKRRCTAPAFHHVVYTWPRLLQCWHAGHTAAAAAAAATDAACFSSHRISISAVVRAAHPVTGRRASRQADDVQRSIPTQVCYTYYLVYYTFISRAVVACLRYTTIITHLIVRRTDTSVLLMISTSKNCNAYVC